MRNGDFVWHCKRTMVDGIETFSKPEKYQLRLHFLTVQPASGYDNVVEFGEDLSRTWNAMGQPYQYWFSKVHEGDRFYIDGAEPMIPTNGCEPEDGWGFDANARVYSVRPQNEAVRFILRNIE